MAEKVEMEEDQHRRWRWRKISIEGGGGGRDLERNMQEERGGKLEALKCSNKEFLVPIFRHW
jgi:hypothetical protein